MMLDDFFGNVAGGVGPPVKRHGDGEFILSRPGDDRRFRAMPARRRLPTARRMASPTL
jgi:hypothetical protein